jgi:flagella basal body P-ring formation protein FlgA
VLAQTPCLTVTGDQILGSDLARAVPAFAHISPNAPLAQSPTPGNTRVFHFSELQSIGARFSVPISSAQEACFRLETQPLNSDRIAEAMRKALQLPDARIEVLETSPAAAPAGTIEFTRDNLGVPAASDSKTPVPWRGDVVYAGSRRFPIWAKVRISAQIGRLTAVEALRPGVSIKPDQVRMELVEGFPQPASRTTSIDQLAGMTVLRPIAAGGEIRPENLTRPNDVNRGDTVLVEVQFGAAHLALTGRAESGGHQGDVVEVRNPDTSKVFQARVEGPDRVIVGPPLQVIARPGN